MGVTFHFLNVGDGDCTIVHFPPRACNGRSKNERIMMIDVCHHDDGEYEDVIEYYKHNFRNPDGSLKPIFRYVCTHPHHDHICGLKRFIDEPGIQILNFWDLTHSFIPDDFDHHPTHKEDWKAYKALGGENSSAIVIKTTREDAPAKFWDEDEDRITILSPSKSLAYHAHYKDDGTKKQVVEVDEMSYALMIKINDRKVVLAGDGRATPCWENIYENCKDEILNCAVLKAPHHGQESGFHKEAVKAMNPALIVFSNNKSEDELYGAEKLYASAAPNALLLKTYKHGTITVTVPFDGAQRIIYSTSK